MKKQIDYIPNAEVQFYLWQGVFMSVAGANLALLGIPSAKWTFLQGLQTTYQNAYVLAPPHGDHKKSDVTARNVARKNYESGIGGIRKIVAQYIAKNDAVSDKLKVQLGLHVEDTILTEARVAEDVPDIQLKSNSPGMMTFIFREAGNPKGRGKEAGMHHCLIQFSIGEPPPATADNCTKHIEAQRSPHTEYVSNSQKRLYGFACWVDTRGHKGPWSDVFSAVIT
ncbi:MAG: hypothetical protein V1781_00770 [Bacteroidota bacterium]